MKAVAEAAVKAAAAGEKRKTFIVQMAKSAMPAEYADYSPVGLIVSVAYKPADDILL